MQKIRYLDKLVDELARGKSMDKVLRGLIADAFDVPVPATESYNGVV